MLFFSHQNVGTFLLNVMNDANCNVCIMAEALDAIMDVFAEDNTDGVLKSLRLVPQVAAATPKFYKKARKEKRNLGEYKALISTVRVNLPQFVSYKNKRLES
ncbi:HEAT repeat-containing protein 3-like [Nilaparvata lugens]|uniref:HEAT repeat-containing protein 3-like n=1 Tax=Nilaparvata lugens TaxID=108931 RepID=UPI00193DAA6E|nr:HEAT repeat-containing protein 3-like [Nilaparvata lugens]